MNAETIKITAPTLRWGFLSSNSIVFSIFSFLDESQSKRIVFVFKIGVFLQ